MATAKACGSDLLDCGFIHCDHLIMSKRQRKKPHAQTQHSPAKEQVTLAPAWPVIVLAMLGVLVTGYLTWSAWTSNTPALCSAGSSCDVIQQSQWSTLFDLPLSLWGFGLYALIAVVGLYGKTTPLKRRRHLWRLALIGLVISLGLTLVGILSLKAVCGWCLLSLAIITALFLLIHLKRPDAAPGSAWRKWWLGNGVLALLVLGIMAAYHHNDLLQRPENPQTMALAIHLKETGAKYYGASWCQNCRQQTRLFGPSAHRLPYVECSPGGPNSRMSAVCTSANVTGYPTWVIDGRPYEGVQPLSQLAALSGFEWQQ